MEHGLVRGSNLLQLLPSCSRSWNGGRGLAPLHPPAERGLQCDLWKRALYPLEFRALYTGSTQG